MSASPPAAAPPHPQAAGVPAAARAPGLGRRLLCAAYEFCLLFGVTFISNYLLLSLAQWRWPLNAVQQPILQAYTLCVIGVYFIYFWGRGGQTLAMKTWRIRLVGPDGGRASLLACCLRYALLWWGLLPGAIVFALTRHNGYAALIVLASVLFSWVWMWFDRDRQFLHDRMLGTRLIQV